MYILEKRHSHVHLHPPLKPHSHHHGKKEKTKKGPKKKKHEHTKKSPEKRKSASLEEDGTPTVPDIADAPEEKLERNIVDQTISVLPEIGEDEILATPPKQGWLSEMADTTAPVKMEEPSVVDVPKEAERTSARHRHKPDENDKKDASTSKSTSRHHKHHHRHRHKSELQERRRPGVATITEKNKVTATVPAPDASALDQKDVEDMKCKLLMLSV